MLLAALFPFSLSGRERRNVDIETVRSVVLIVLRSREKKPIAQSFARETRSAKLSVSRPILFTISDRAQVVSPTTSYTLYQLEDLCLKSVAVICSHDHSTSLRSFRRILRETNLVYFRVYNEPICSTSTDRSYIHVRIPGIVLTGGFMGGRDFDATKSK